MAVNIIDIENSSNIGIFFKSNDKYILIPNELPDDKIRNLKSYLNVEPIISTISGTRLNGPLTIMNNSGILVSENATLNANGAHSLDQENLENEIIFEGDRLEPGFSDVAGQWGTLWFFENSVNNTINYATIKNATVAILSDENADAPNDKLTITNTQIYNSSNFGILGRNTSIRAENLVINNSGQSSFAATLGGKYNVTHSTIGNYWTNSSRQLPALLINNFLETNT